MTEYCWSFGRERRSGNGARDVGTWKPTTVTGQACLTAGKTATTAVLGDNCESARIAGASASTSPCRNRNAAADDMKAVKLTFDTNTVSLKGGS
ncbi:hypothetical protein [Candidatus Cryosericum septentrionale]|jgi:hypothetical protein|uniref:Uncharacterized protein n=1 Tax=Candidatus Cryosericum septentrionale TaxID=2290913 RepID=A0A398DT43_9BACT|nr:hypothetical protein [Candidatus Cryosericum septentrionale]RIE17229.1 hypothetical protein SMC1_02605 [Candidatus Cryosericum septentrionale]